MIKFNFFRYAMVLVALVSATVLFTGCPNSECDGVECLNGGKCVVNNGIAECDCADGYSGPACENYDACWNIECDKNANSQFTPESPVYNTVSKACECFCQTGYEGDQCDKEMRAKFLGSYKMSDECNSGTYVNNVTVTTSAGAVNEFVINNFTGLQGSAVKATILSYDEAKAEYSYEIKAQTGTYNAPEATQFSVESTSTGTLKVNGATKTMAIAFKLTVGGVVDNCTSLLESI